MITPSTARKFFATLRQDVGDALRSLRRDKGVTIGVVLTLTLGLGANNSMFNVLDAIYFRTPPAIRAPAQLRRVWTRIQLRDGAQFWPGFSYPQYAAAKAALGTDASTTLFSYPEAMSFGSVSSDLEVRVSRATASYFEVLGVRPVVGRFYSTDEDRLGAPADVAVASYTFWRQHLNGDSSAIGHPVIIAGHRYVLIGIAERAFKGVELDATDLWLPLATEPAIGPSPWWRGNRLNGFQLVLRSAVARGDADAMLEQRIALGLRAPEAQGRPADTANVVRVSPIMRAQGPGNKAQEVQLALRLAGVTGIVLLIACANVGNLLLARTVRRRRDIALRLAIGISQRRLLRLFVMEAVVLALLSAVGALVAAYWGASLLRGVLFPEVNWGDGASPAHWRVVGYTAGIGLAAGVLAGILPGVRFASADIARLLSARNAWGAGGSRYSGRLLVIAQTALSVVALAGSGLFVRSLSNVQAAPIGFDASRLVYGRIRFDTRDSARDVGIPETMRQVAARIRQLPDVETVALAGRTPMRGFGMMAFYPDVDTTRFHKPLATFNAVSPDFFRATGTRLLRGTDFPRGMRAMPPVVVVNDAMARAQWPGMDALGHCLRFAPDGVCYQIIGVVESAVMNALLEKPQPQYYLPLDNLPLKETAQSPTLVVRTEPGALATVAAELRGALLESFAGGRPSVVTMEQVLDPQYHPWRLGASLFTAFGLLALILAAVGVYSTVTYATSQRTREFGIRAALGATAGDIIGQVVASTLTTVAVGAAIGLALALAGGRLIAALLFGIGPRDPMVFAGAVAAMLLTAILAATGPAWRAAHVNPVDALRIE